MKKNFLLFIFSLLSIFLFVEVLVRIFFPQDLQRYWVVQEPKYGLNVNKKNYIHKLHRFKSYKTQYKFGKYRNRETLEKKLNKKDKILILGDSFTFGWLLKDEDTFIHKLQEKNLSHNFVNVAVGAWGSAHYTLFTELFCNIIKPNKIFLFLNTDDFYRGFASNFYTIEGNKLLIKKKKYVDIAKDSKFDQNIPAYKFLKQRSHAFMLLRNSVFNLINKPYVHPWSKDRYWPRPELEFSKDYGVKIQKINEMIFLRLQSVSSDCGADLHIFFNGWVKPNKMKDNNPNKIFLLNLNNFFLSNNIKYYENYQKMRKLYENPMKYIIKVDFHPNEKGANLLYLSFKDTIKQILKKN